MALPKIPIVVLQVVVVVHFILTVWANQAQWLPTSYQFCNFLVLGVGVGAIAASSNSQLAELFFVGMAFAIIHDVIVMAKFYSDANGVVFEGIYGQSHFRFCFAMAIINIILKPVSCVLIFLNYIGREGPGLKDGITAARMAQGTRPAQHSNEPLPKPEGDIPAY